MPGGISRWVGSAQTGRSIRSGRHGGRPARPRSQRPVRGPNGGDSWHRSKERRPSAERPHRPNPGRGSPHGACAPPRIESTTKRSIVGRLLFWFLVIALVPCVILTATTARLATRTMEDSVRANLARIAATKAAELESDAAGRIRDVTALCQSPDLIRALRPQDAGDSGATSGTGYLDALASSMAFSHAVLIDADGRIIHSADDLLPIGGSLVTGGLATSQLASGFTRARSLLQADLTGFQTYGSLQRPWLSPSGRFSTADAWWGP